MLCDYCKGVCFNRYCDRCYDIYELAMQKMLLKQYEWQKAKPTPFFKECFHKSSKNGSPEENRAETKRYFFRNTRISVETLNAVELKNEMDIIAKDMATLHTRELEIVVYFRYLEPEEETQSLEYLRTLTNEYNGQWNEISLNVENISALTSTEIDLINYYRCLTPENQLQSRKYLRKLAYKCGWDKKEIS